MRPVGHETSARPLPALIGVIHLQPLPDSPRFGGSMQRVVDGAAADATALEEAGFEAAIVENFGDAPFIPARVDAATVASMTRCALAVASTCPRLEIGVNVLRNDAHSALAVAAATGATLVRVNVHCGARLTDQGVVEGRAHETLRRRHQLGLSDVRLLCDVAVKHSAALAPRPIAEEALEVTRRGLADALLVTGSGTAIEPDLTDLAGVLGAVPDPVLVASGVTLDNLAELLSLHAGGRSAHGVVIGSSLRANGKPGGPIDPERATRFAAAFWELRGASRASRDPDETTG